MDNQVILHNGDCMDWLQGLEEHSVDAIITDPPYAMTRCAWDKQIDLDVMWGRFERVLRPGGVVVVFSAEPFTARLIESNRARFRHKLIWLQNRPTGHLNAQVAPLKAYEEICVFSPGGYQYTPQMEDGYPRKVASAASKKSCKASEVYGKATKYANYDSTKRYPIDVVYYPAVAPKERLHPNQKPVELLEYLVSTYTLQGQVVCDPFMGAGSTGVACRKTGRAFRGCELDAGYHELSQRRILGEEETNG